MPNSIANNHVRKLKELKKMRYLVQQEHTYLKNTHDYVMNELKSESTTIQCNIENYEFHIQEKELKQLENQPLYVIHNFMTNYIEIMNRYFLKNTDLFPLCYEIFSKNNILIKSIGHNAHRTIYLMNEYNVQVNWEDNDKGTMQNLQEKYENAHNLNWKDNNLKDIKIYYDSVFSFFKVIMLRLTWKHLLYVNKQQNESIRIVLINKWLKILDEFVTFFYLKNDDYVCMIKNSINGLCV
ncbi:uncharacterized protein LOC126904982 [Daktulosphaira vitifoliae]|uniref:uncharacterized protein LOC126904982 n=1 Tax=Daktulosphaira vitifoliae TaxID=58002 RepID=UPI0021AAC280|nr:uncharacterized protein LOC126904982 [Daktulosphaira vitifoliae]